MDDLTDRPAGTTFITESEKVAGSGSVGEDDRRASATQRPAETTADETMEKREKPDPERVAFLRFLPLEIKQQITGEEAEAFMYNRELPDSLLEKLKEYLVEPDQQE